MATREIIPVRRNDRLSLLSSAPVSVATEFKVFAGLSPDEIQTILAATVRQTITSGQEICRQGEEGNSMYLCASGRTQVTVQKPGQPEPTVINSLGPGSHFGAMSMLIGSPRSASVTAIMDTEVLQLDRQNFDRLVESVPGFAANLSRTLGGWLRGQLTGHRESKAIRVVGFVHSSSAHAMLAPAVMSALARTETSMLAFTSHPESWSDLGSQNNIEIYQLQRDSIDAPLSVPILAEKVEKYSHTMIDVHADEVTAKQLLQCERVWWILDRDGNESQQLGKVRALINDVPELARRIQIVETHDKSDRLPPVFQSDVQLTRAPIRIQRNPGRDGSDATSTINSAANFYGFRRQDVARLQHQVQGINLGLVLGGGGARGLAHIGAIETFESHGLYFDQIAGTSAGSIVGCAYASGMNPAEILRLINQEMSPPKWIQKLPRGKRIYLFLDFRRGRIETKLKKYFFDYDLNQLLIPIHTVAVDLIGGSQLVSSHGDVASSIRASANHPVFGAPIMRDGLALVDGAVLNNVPATVLRERNADYILSIDVGSKLDPDFANSQSKRKGTINTASTQSKKQNVGYVSTLMRVLEIIQRGHSKTHLSESDFVIAPDTSAFPFEDFTKANELAEVGKAAAETALPDFLESLEPYLTIPPGA
jgi:predicted acylesterase/phospholipase RssA/CRP-like cAMP-binding protein